VHPLSPDLPEGALMSVVFLTLMTSAEGSEAPGSPGKGDEAESTSVDYEFAFEIIMRSLRS